MSKNGNYFLNKKLINDFECKHNYEKKPYNRYCFTCQKNICALCKGHESHSLISLESMFNKEKYEKYDKNILKMYKTGKEIKKKFEEIVQIKKYFNDFINLLNETYKELETFNNGFESHLKFNETIYNCYKEDKKNYYILNNFNSLNFDLESDYLNYDSNLLIFDGLMNRINGVQEFKGNNMWISEKYCKNWGLREAIREFIQNQYDGIISLIGSKKNLKVTKIGNEYLINERKKYLDYDFLNKIDNKIFGKIRYDKNKKILSISNEGELLLADFLLGGSKSEENNPDIIGTFGEGMKLAILALCRLDKEVTIISSNKKYNFYLKEDSNFIKKSQPQKCLHCQIENYYDNDMDNQVKVIIHNINEEEWGNQIDNFLWLLGNDIEIYTSVDKNNKEIGQIIYEDHLKNRVYVKGIFVQTIKEKQNSTKEKDKDKDKDENKIIPGINANLKLDRDRNCIQSSSELRSIIAKIISGTMNKNIEFLKDIQQNKGGTFVKTEYGYEKVKSQGNGKLNTGLKKFTSNLISCLEKGNIIDYWEISYNLSTESFGIIWNEMDSKPENKNKQPSYDTLEIKNFIDEKKLPEEFYPFYKVNYELMHILKKCPLYKDIKRKFAEYAEKSQDVEPKNEYKLALSDIYSKIQFIMPNFSGNQVKFKKFTTIDKYFCFKNNEQIYFSSLKLEEKLNEEWKFWIFIKILKISNIKIEDSYALFNQVFKKNN